MDTRKAPDSASPIEGYEAPFVGFRWLLGKPRLWLLPILGTLIAWCMLLAVLLLVTYKVWPLKGSTLYSLKIFQALGIGSIAALVAWLFVFPVILNFFFEHLIKHVLLAKGDSLPETSFFRAAWSGIYILLKTWHWRVFWIILGIAMLWICAPLAFVILQLGVVYVALIDGCDLTLGLQGVVTSKKWEFIKAHQKGFIAGAFTGGIVSCFLMPTVLVWLFWIPGIYVGAALWVRTWHT